MSEKSSMCVRTPALGASYAQDPINRQATLPARVRPDDCPCNGYLRALATLEDARTLGMRNTRIPDQFDGWSEDNARLALDQWKQSGKMIAVFARAHGVSAPRCTVEEAAVLQGGAIQPDNVVRAGDDQHQGTARAPLVRRLCGSDDGRCGNRWRGGRNRHGHAATSLPEIEKATLRVVALRVSANNVAQAAGLLGMAPISLDR